MLEILNLECLAKTLRVTFFQAAHAMSDIVISRFNLNLEITFQHKPMVARACQRANR
jgi:hypothetical protein